MFAKFITTPTISFLVKTIKTNTERVTHAPPTHLRQSDIHCYSFEQG